MIVARSSLAGRKPWPALASPSTSAHRSQLTAERRGIDNEERRRAAATKAAATKLEGGDEEGCDEEGGDEEGGDEEGGDEEGGDEEGGDEEGGDEESGNEGAAAMVVIQLWSSKYRCTQELMAHASSTFVYRPVETVTPVECCGCPRPSVDSIIYVRV